MWLSCRSVYYLININHLGTNKNLSIMFTGIIEGLGNIVRFDKKTSNRSAAKMKIKLGKIAKTNKSSKNLD